MSRVRRAGQRPRLRRRLPAPPIALPDARAGVRREARCSTTVSTGPRASRATLALVTELTPVTGVEWRELPPRLQAVTPVLRCFGCGAVKQGMTGDPTDIEPSGHCGECPPWTCEDCGETCSAAALCPCWVKLDGLPLADIKGLLAQAGLSVGGLREPPLEL